MLCRSMESHSLTTRPAGSVSVLMRVDGPAFRLGCLLAALGVYALRGSPTPDSPGWPEMLTGFLLLVAVGFSGAKSAVRLSFSTREGLWLSCGKILLFYGLSVSLLMAGIGGHGAGQVLRDILPFLFFLLPVFMVGHFQTRPGHVPYFLFAVIILGFVFALRSLLAFYPFSLLSAGFPAVSQELFYFANAPTVLFAALFLLGMSGEKIVNATRLKSIMPAMVVFALALVPLLAMAASTQRATLGGVVLYMGVLTLVALWKRPTKSVRLVLVMLLVVWACLPVLLEIMEILGRKNSLVGSNMRTQEALAVWDAVSDNPGHLLFGLGWGGSFHSPAVGGLSVNFTHSLLTSMLLKTGLVGLFLTCTYIFGLLSLLSKLLLKRPVLALALAAPVLIDMFLYASFKSLDFGLILLLIPVYQFYLKGLGDPKAHA